MMRTATLFVAVTAATFVFRGGRRHTTVDVISV